MPVVQHLWELLLCAVVLFSPIPLCLWLVFSTKRFEKPMVIAHHLLIFLTGWCVVETSLGLGLGMVQAFNLGAILLAEILLFVVGIGLLWKQGWRFSDWRVVLQPEPKLDRYEVLILGAIAFAGFVLLERLITQPIINFDSLAYHLPAMARWTQTGTFSILEQFQYNVGFYPYGWEVLCGLLLFPFKEDFLVTLPNIAAWIILGLSVYLLSQTAGATRVYSMAGACLVLTMPLLMQHINTIHVDLPFAAFFMAGLYFLIAFHQNRSIVSFVLCLNSMGLLLGIKTSAIVYTAVLIGVFIFLEAKSFFSQSEAKNFAKQFGFLVDRFAAGLTIIGIVCCLFVGLFWYVKNFIATGNPLGFVKIQIGDTVIFPGTLTSAEVNRNSLAKIFNPFNFTHWVVLGGRIVFWLQLPFLLLFFQVLRLPMAIAKPKQRLSQASLIGVLALLLLTGWLYWNTPYSAASSGVPSELETWQSSLLQLKLSSFFGKALRFAFPFLAMLGVGAAVSATLMQVRVGVATFLVLLSTIICTVETTILEAFFANSFQTGGGTVGSIVSALKVSPVQGVGAFVGLLAANTNLIFGILCLGLILGLSGLVLRGVEPIPAIADTTTAWASSVNGFGAPARTILAVTCVGLLLAGSYAVREKRDANRQAIYGGIYEYIAAEVCPTEVIGYSDSYRSYLFYGKDFSRSVVYVPTRIEDKIETLPNWLNVLQQRQVDVVAIGPVPSRKDWQTMPQAQWFEDPNGAFERVFGEKPWAEPTLYRVKGQTKNCNPSSPSI
jgi:hypothetical protein